MTNCKIELVKAFARVLADMASNVDKIELDIRIYRTLFLAQLILIVEFGSKEDIPKDLVAIAWTKEDGKVVEDRWATRLCYVSEKAPNITFEEVSSLMYEFVNIMNNWEEHEMSKIEAENGE